MHSLRTKLTLSHGLVVLLAVVLVGLLSTWLINRGFDQLGRLQAQRDAEQIAALLARSIDTTKPQAELLRSINERVNAPDAAPLLRTAPFVLADARQRVILDRGGELEGALLPLALRRSNQRRWPDCGLRCATG